MRKNSKLEERTKKIELLAPEDLTRKEIAERLGMKYTSLCSYLYLHPEIPRLRIKRNSEKEDKIKRLLEEDLSQSEIAERLKVTRAAISDYLGHHPELERPKDRRYNKIRELIEKGLTRKEIANKVKMHPNSLDRYLVYHLELPRPRIDNIRNKQLYYQVKQLLEQGLSQNKIAKYLGDKNNTRIYHLMRRHPELREIYEQNRERK